MAAALSEGISHRSSHHGRADAGPAELKTVEAVWQAPAGRAAKPAELSHTSVMPEKAPGWRPQRAAVYWRRRVAVLVISMSVLAGISWSATTLIGGRAWGGRAAASGPRPPARSLQQASGTGAAASGAHGNVTAESRLAVPAHQASRSCPVGDVVVTLSGTQTRYSAWQQPQFAVDVVSLASYPCTFDVGAAHVLLQISAGSAQVWTSADCAEGKSTQPATLHHGVPAVVSMTWDEQYSSTGCPVPGRAAPPGSYTARATDGSAISPDVTFTIS